MENLFQTEILQMSKFRYQLINKENNEKATKEEIQKIDELGKEIFKYIKSYFDFLSVDFILEELSKIGMCPSLIYDDNGHWAIATDGFQNVASGDEPQDMEIIHYNIEAKYWKNTVREALLFFINKDDE